MKKTPLLACLTLLALPAVQAQRPRNIGRVLQPSVLRTSGSATVKAAPDQATVNIGVVTRAETAEEAARDNAAQVREVLKAMKAELGEDGEIQTSNYSIYPERTRPPRGGGAPEITGYTAQNTVEVRITDIEKVGPVIDAAAKSGSNQIQGVAFGLQDDSELRAKALQQAARKARADAEALASGLGLRVKRIVSIEEGQPAVAQPRRYAMAEAAMAADTPIEAGEISVRASVTITVEFEPEDPR